MTTTGAEMLDFIERLYPISRSITGNGVRETLAILGERIPLEVREVPTGTQVSDWKVPKEWNIRDATEHLKQEVCCRRGNRAFRLIGPNDSVIPLSRLALRWTREIAICGVRSAEASSLCGEGLYVRKIPAA